MNGAKKFHSPDGPAFNEGEVWEGSSKSKVVIIRTERYGVDKWDVDVYYTQVDGSTCNKNAWSFQVRYEHQADKEI
jgi:hypothetical protein